MDPGNSEYNYLQHGRHIVKEFRSQALARFGLEFFSEENNYGAIYKVKTCEKKLTCDIKKNKKIITIFFLQVKTNRVYELPIFWEFVQYIIIHGKEASNEHWCPNYLYCTPCTAHFQYIIKFETMDAEADRLRRVWKTTDIKDQWLNRNDGGMPKDNITMEYFKMLDKQDIRKLYEIYEPDFREHVKNKLNFSVRHSAKGGGGLTPGS